MPLSISVKPDARSARELVKRNGKSTYRWRCACGVNKRYLSKCPTCKMRREDGERVDG